MKWNGTKTCISTEKKTSGILFSTISDLKVSAPSGKGTATGMRGEPVLAAAFGHDTKSKLNFTSYVKERMFYLLYTAEAL